MSGSVCSGGGAGSRADGFILEPLPPGSVIEVVLTSSSGDQIRTFADKDGVFALRGVAPGSHVISTYNPKFVYPEIRVDVSPGGVLERVSFVFNGLQLLAAPLVIRPAGVAQYYEARAPVDVVGFFKSPYGLMIGFSVFAMVVMPMMKVDPEEYREAMASIRGGQAAGQVAAPPPALGMSAVQQRRQQAVAARGG
ncbi:MAG: hypothetical protein J3K34DRAFT_470765 [Monoraphidium minutum]|nr:MAG: hypothetical protein J3K34DRAFT_470765 [Monoraphidium minutum]